MRVKDETEALAFDLTASLRLTEYENKRDYDRFQQLLTGISNLLLTGTTGYADSGGGNDAANDDDVW